MVSKRIMMSALAASMAVVPGTRAFADFKDGLVGGLVGGAVSGIIVNESAKARERKNATTTTKQRTYAPVDTVSRQQVLEEQSALNYFGFPAGKPDGVRGRMTYDAVAQYQAHMGYPITGTLNDYERQFLISSHYRAQSGGAATAQLIAERGQGTRGLLHAYRDEAAGLSAPGTTMAAVPAPATTTAASPAPAAPAPDSAPVLALVPGSGTGQAAPAQAALPNLMGGSGSANPSLASHCNQISLLTNSNGGFVTEASLSDARFALNEQFCLARTYAITAGEKMASSLQGVSTAQLEETCRAYTPVLRDYVASLSLSPKDEILPDVRNFILQSGQSPAEISGTAKICLSVGYRTDNLDVALGSALLLTALGEGVYAELLGHHLNEGFGVNRRPDLAVAWYEASLEAVEKGAEPVFAPGDAGRTGLLRKAVFQTGNGQVQGASPETVQPAATLPTLKVQ